MSRSACLSPPLPWLETLSISQESDIDEDIFYKAIDEDKINEFEQQFYAALSCQNSSDAKRKDMHEDEDDDNGRSVKKTK